MLPPQVLRTQAGEEVRVSAGEEQLHRPQVSFLQLSLSPSLRLVCGDDFFEIIPGKKKDILV